MIDTHCHLLPAVDDGPSSAAASVGLARRLHQEGVRIAVCTPHYSTRYPTSHRNCEAVVLQLREHLAELGIPLDLVLAAEISPKMMLAAPLEEILRRSIGGRYVLVELQPNTESAFLREALDRLDGHGVVPVLGHPERCRAVRRSPGVLDPARERGALVQVVAPSLAGAWGPETRRTAWRLVDDGIADIVASDAHGTRDAANLGAIARLIHERHGDERRRRLLDDVPASVVFGSAPSDAVAPSP